MKNSEESAFPMVESWNDSHPEILVCNQKGLTKRDYFAGLAMQAILTANSQCYWGNRDGQSVPSEVAKDAIAMADEVLKQLEV